MKSKTSSFNKTVFKKDLTRFAPAWGAYFIVLLLVLISMSENGRPYYRVQDVQTAINVTVWANLIYGGVVAQLLFGDLFTARHCNALHALPLRRECWFGSHVAAGLTFSFLPNLLVMLIALPVLNLGVGWSAVLWWLLGAELQYVFFFGTAVLCVMLSGNRFGQLALYAMISFAGLAAAWLTISIYQPLLHGIKFDEKAFHPFCPLAKISQLSDLLVIDYEEVWDDAGSFLYNELLGIAPGEGWGYMAVCAGVGVLALLLALVLYRRRRLECAGDFVAFSKLEPMVLVLVTVFAGGVFHVFGDAFGMNMKYVLVFCGMAVGYFACRMMLERTTRVFRKKTFLGCGVIMVVFALTMGITYLDPMGITRYVPEASEVESVTVSQSYTLRHHNEFPFTVTEEADIAAILGVHEDCIDHSASVMPDDTEENYSLLNLRIEYKMKDGQTLNRFYDVHPRSEAGQVLKDYFTTPECVLGFPPEQVGQMVKRIRSFYMQGHGGQEINLHDLDMEGLLQAIIADCEAGNMAQFGSYHYPTNYDLLGLKNIDDVVAFLEISWEGELSGGSVNGVTTYYGSAVPVTYTNIRVYASCGNTIRWLEESDLLTEEMKQEFAEKFGGAYFAWTN